MAVNEILFKELPFRPDHNQVFYIENGYDVDANDFIRRNYYDLKSMFAHIGMDFYYLPYLLREGEVLCSLPFSQVTCERGSEQCFRSIYLR